MVPALAELGGDTDRCTPVPKLLESLTFCATLEMFVVTDRVKRAYKEAKADTRATVVTCDLDVR